MDYKKLYRYTSQGEGVWSAGKRLLPEHLAAAALEQRKWMPKPVLPDGDYVFYLTTKGKEQYEKTLLTIHSQYLPHILCQEIDSRTIGSIVYEDEWQIVVKK
jgi:hypothetical protein